MKDKGDVKKDVCWGEGIGCDIRGVGISDYGFYGKTGTFDVGDMPVGLCTCGTKPVIKCEYDDTPGFRETYFQLICTKCGKTDGSPNTKWLIRDWNNDVAIKANRIKDNK